MTSPRVWLKSIIGSGAEWLSRNGFPRLASLWGDGGSSWSGESVTEQSALNRSGVWACRSVIGSTVGFIPLNLMQRVGQDKRFATEKPMFSAMHNAPNEEMTAMSFRETLTGHVLMQGNCFSKIERRSGTGEALQLIPLMPEWVIQDREKTGRMRLVYVVKPGNSQSKTYTVDVNKPHDILHIQGMSFNGIDGLSVVSYARHSFGVAAAVERYASRHFATGGRQTGFIEQARKFQTPEDMQKFREDLNKYVQNPETSHQWPVFEPGQKFVPGGFSPQDSQFLETRKFSLAEICRWFGVPPHMIGDLDHATFSNIEEQELDFVKRTLTAWTKRWEQNLWRCVLTPEERANGYFFNHNFNALVRGDFATRMTGYATGLQNGFLSPNEVRDLEDMNRFEGGDDYHIQLNMQTLGAGAPTASQQATLLKLGSSKKGVYLQ